MIQNKEAHTPIFRKHYSHRQYTVHPTTISGCVHLYRFLLFDVFFVLNFSTDDPCSDIKNGKNSQSGQKFGFFFFFIFFINNMKIKSSYYENRTSGTRKGNGF